jgi:predicted nuclease of predicted toxin-antitoxin system
MKFLVDAQLPFALVTALRNAGFDTIHTSELPLGNDTPDTEINRISIAEQRVVVSKDGDFFDSFTRKAEPYKLLHIRTGNVDNRSLCSQIERNLDQIVAVLTVGEVVEITKTYLFRII